MTDTPPETLYVVLDTDHEEGDRWAAQYGGAFNDRSVIREKRARGRNGEPEAWCEDHGEEVESRSYRLADDPHGVPVCRECIEGYEWVEMVTDDARDVL